MLKNPIVISSLDSQEMTQRIKSSLNAESCELDIRIFSDGESRVRINQNLKNKDIVLLQSLYPNTDRKILQLLMILHKCRDERPSSTTLVIPYLPYSRQDRSFLDGEVVSLKVMIDLFNYFKVNKLITVDVHNEHSFYSFSSQTNLTNITAIPTIAEYFKRNFRLNNPIIASPDKGGSNRAKIFATHFSDEYFYLNKSRDRNTGEIKTQENDIPELNNRDVIIIDDIISTGTSIIKACEVIKKNNAQKIYVACTHALLLDKALERIKEIGIEDTVSTNSIINKATNVDLTEMLIHEMKKL